MDLRIESRNVSMTPRWRKEIESRMTDLESGYDDLIHGRVTLVKNRHHRKAPDAAEAAVVVKLPRRRTITARKSGKSVLGAIHAAFSAMEHELQKYREKRASKQVRGTRRALRSKDAIRQAARALDIDAQQSMGRSALYPPPA